MDLKDKVAITDSSKQITKVKLFSRNWFLVKLFSDDKFH